MGRAYKRTRIKTGPNFWINKTQRNNGTTFTSVSNKAGNTTTNISSRGVRKTQNNNGWAQKSFWNGNAKTRSKSSSSRSSKNVGLISSFFKESKSTRSSKKIDETESCYDPPDYEVQTIIAFIFGIPVVTFLLSFFISSFLYSFGTAIFLYLVVVTLINREWPFYLLPLLFLISPIGWIYVLILFLIC